MNNHFKAYNDILNRIRIRNIQLARLKDDWYSISGTKYDEMKIKGGKMPDIADQLHKIVEREEELRALINYRDELRKIHELEIDKITDSTKKAILKLYYLDECSIKEIASAIKKSVSHTKKLKGEAVKEFKEKCK